MPFRFHDLLDEIRCKILRQYVPVYTKASVLSHMSEFGNILNDNDSWQHSFEKCPEKYPSIPSIEPGVYISDDEWWNTLYVVSKDAESISFALYSIDDIVKPDSSFYSEECVWPTTLEITPSDLREFLSKFTEGHTLWDERNVNYFVMYPGQTCAVNHIKNKLFWIDRTMHRIRRNGKCCVKRGPKGYIKIVVRNDGMMQTRPYGHCRWEHLDLRQEPLNAFIKSPHLKLKLKFKMEQDCSTSVDLSMDFDSLLPFRCFFFKMPIFKIALDRLRDRISDYHLQNSMDRDYEYSSYSSD